MKEIDVYPFRIINREYPDLNNYKFTINIPNKNLQINIIEQWATGTLYVSIPDTQYQIPLRYNTNLLPSLITDNTLYYDIDRQAFIYASIND